MNLGSNSPSGANFCAHGLDLGADVIAISRSPEKHSIFLPYKWKNRRSIIFEQLDFNYDMERLETLIRRHRPKYIVN